MKNHTRFMPSGLTTNITGWILLAMLILAVLAALSPEIPGYLPGILVWVSTVLMIRQQKRNQLIQSGILFAIGVIGLSYGYLSGIDNRYIVKALEANQLLIAMLISISFLRIVAAQNIKSDEQLPRGRMAIIRTLFGGHLIGSVINMSSVMIMGDRLSHAQKLQPLQGLMLLRSFSSAAVWSPFFASMGVILISAPGAQLSTLMLFGLPVAVIALSVSAWQISRHPEAEEVQGYPMHFSALWMPLLLAVLVMIAHWLWPEQSVITLVTVISILFVMLYLPLKNGRQGALLFREHIHTGLPRLGSEITLFLAAAVLASGVAALLESLQIRLAPEHFTAPEASITLFALVALAMIGMHPVTSAILAGSILMPSVSDPDFLGLTLLLSWMIGVGASPFSGVQLTLQSRYGISALALIRLNLFYTPFLLALGTAVIWIYAGSRGLA